MSEISVFEFRFNHDKKTLVEALRACRRSITFSHSLWMHTVFGIVVGITIFLGCLALVMLLFRVVGLSEFTDYAQLIVPIGILLFILVLKYYRERLAIQLLKSPLFSGEVEVVAMEDGLEIINPVMKWQLKWAAVDAVLSFRSGLGFRVGNIVIPIPKRAIPSDVGAAKCTNQLEAWRKAAR